MSAVPESARTPHVQSRSAGVSRLDTHTPVVVLSAKTHGSLGIMRSLGRLGIRVYAVDSDPRGPASYSKYLSGRFVFDLGSSTPAATVEYLLEIGRVVGSRPLLIPTWDETAVLVSEYHDVLSERFLLPHQPQNLARSLTNKKSMHQLAAEGSVATPAVTFPANIEDVRRYAATGTFPVVLKGIDGNRLKSRTGKKMVIVKRRNELERLYAKMEDLAAPNLMLQEYIPGGGGSVWMFNGYFDAQSDCIVRFTGRKLHQFPVDIGPASLGVCESNEVIETTTTRWMKQLGYRGILDVDYCYDARDRQYKVLDVNPRIGATFRLFVSRNAMDVVRALYLDMTGQPVPMTPQPVGRKWMLEEDLIACLQYRRDGRLTLREWATSLRGVEEAGYYARDDIAPFLRVFSSVMRRRANVM